MNCIKRVLAKIKLSNELSWLNKVCGLYVIMLFITSVIQYIKLEDQLSVLLFSTFCVIMLVFPVRYVYYLVTTLRKGD